MTSSDDNLKLAVDYAVARIGIFQSSPLKSSAHLNSLIYKMIAFDGTEYAEDILPQLLLRSRNSKVIFRALKYLAANLIAEHKPLPRELEMWLINVLRHQIEEPNYGRTGPNKSILEQSFLLGLVNALRSITGLPVWIRETQKQNSSVLELLALASSDFKKANGSSPIPITPKAIEKRFIQARQLVLGQKDFEFLKKTEFPQEDA